ncbi:MAG: hypothetical protein GX454_11480 [Brooklawnia sp.]|nr:hypothetical protein [Brooklawnia sp.]
MSDVFALMAAEKANYPVVWMCRLLAVSRASFYRWLRGDEPSPRAARHLELSEQIKAVYDEAEGKAGRDQIVKILGKRGVKVASCTVGVIMREPCIKAVRTWAWKKTTAQDPAARTEHIKNHMLAADGSRCFTSQVPGTRLCGDITYLRADEAGCIWRP